MRGAPGRRARASIVRAGGADLPGAVGQLRGLRHRLGDAGGGAGDVPEHPVEKVFGAGSGGRIEIVGDQDEAGDAVGHVAPRQRRRDLVAGLRVLRRDLAAVRPGRRLELHDLHAAASAAASAGRRRSGRRRPALLRGEERRTEEREADCQSQQSHRLFK
jgi:hypothetical protein